MGLSHVRLERALNAAEELTLTSAAMHILDIAEDDVLNAPVVHLPDVVVGRLAQVDDDRAAKLVVSLDQVADDLAVLTLHQLLGDVAEGAALVLEVFNVAVGKLLQLLCYDLCVQLLLKTDLEDRVTARGENLR